MKEATSYTIREDRSDRPPTASRYDFEEDVIDAEYEELAGPAPSFTESAADVLRSAPWQVYALGFLVAGSAFVSTYLSVKHAILRAGMNGVFIAVSFALLWEVAKTVLPSVGFFHPDNKLALACRLATFVLVAGSISASLGHLGESAELYSVARVRQSVGFRDIQYEREVLDKSISAKQKSAEIDIETGYRKRGLATEDEVYRKTKKYKALGEEQAALLTNKPDSSRLDVPFFIASSMLELIQILGLFLLSHFRRSRSFDHLAGGV